jgi:hypothetical protein
LAGRQQARIGEITCVVSSVGNISEISFAATLFRSDYGHGTLAA